MKEEPQRLHAGFRFAFQLGASHAVILQSDEVAGYEWRPPSEVTSPTTRVELAHLAGRLDAITVTTLTSNDHVSAVRTPGARS